MISSVSFKNFRGFQDGSLEIAPITILTGANNSGKSTTMYALLVLKSLITNANQPLDSLFNLTFMNLGGFKESVFAKADDVRKIILSARCETGAESAAIYTAELGKSESRLSIALQKPAALELGVPATFPYALNGSAGTELEGIKITWNGVTPTVAHVQSPGPPSGDSSISSAAIQEVMGLPALDLKAVEFVPLRRGFTKTNYSAVPLQPNVLNEDEIATFLANDRDLEGAVSHHLERIVDRFFRVRPILGAATFFLQTEDRRTGFVCDLVNDGFGTNELVYLLAKALRPGPSLICVEEPEIHIHPGAQLKLVGELIRIAEERGRNFMVSTHSEHFVVEVLNRVKRKEIAPENVRVYYLRREGRESKIELQKVNEDGQISGGLKSFYETELKQTEEFLAFGKGFASHLQ